MVLFRGGCQFEVINDSIPYPGVFMTDLPAAVRSDSVLLSKHQSLVVQFLVQYVNPQKGEREAGATRNAQRMENPWTFYAARSAWSSYVDYDMLKVETARFSLLAPGL